MSENFSISKTTKGKLPSLPFEHIKDSILGKKYELSLVFIGDKLSKRLNSEHRGKNKATNILSFPLTEHDGEIFINQKQSKKDAPKFKKGYNEFIVFLFIHGCLHLRGLEHGKEMEKQEQKYIKKFWR